MSKDKAIALIEEIEKLSVMDLVELVKAIEDKFGVSAQAPVAVAAAGGEDTVAAAEQTAFNVVLQGVGASKINVIKLVKDLLSLSIKEAKDKVDGAPATLFEGVDKAKAEEVANKLKEIGAEVTVE
jgi:large subunit ribosomal protein L7/L12